MEYEEVSIVQLQEDASVFRVVSFSEMHDHQKWDLRSDHFFIILDL